MIRTLNFTGRQRIPRDAARISLRRESGGSVSFDAELDLSGFDLAGDALIFIEAAFKTTFMRFAWGPVAHPTPPGDKFLTRLEQPELAHFRIKVVEPAASGLGRILAVADYIRPEGIHENSRRRVSLFRVNVTSSQFEEIWRLNLDDEGGPILELNRIPGIKEIARQPAFMALVYPELIRQILHQIFADGYDDPSHEPDRWPARWLRFSAQLVRKAPPPLANEKIGRDQEEWIQEVLTAFCRGHKLTSEFKRRFATTEGEIP